MLYKRGVVFASLKNKSKWKKLEKQSSLQTWSFANVSSSRSRPNPVCVPAFPAFPNISFVYLNWLPQHCALYCGIVVCRMAEREREGSLHPSLILDGQTRNQFRFCSHGRRTTAEWMYGRLTDRVYERCAMPKPPPPSATHKEMEDGGRQREI